MKIHEINLSLIDYDYRSYIIKYNRILVNRLVLVLIWIVVVGVFDVQNILITVWILLITKIYNLLEVFLQSKLCISVVLSVIFSTLIHFVNTSFKSNIEFKIKLAVSASIFRKRMSANKLPSKKKNKIDF